MYLQDFSHRDRWIRIMRILIEERLYQNDFISRLDKGHESAKHAFIGSSSDGDFCLWVYLLTKEGRIRICYCFL